MLAYSVEASRSRPNATAEYIFFGTERVDSPAAILIEPPGYNGSQGAALLLLDDPHVATFRSQNSIDKGLDAVLRVHHRSLRP